MSDTDAGAVGAAGRGASQHAWTPTPPGGQSWPPPPPPPPGGRWQSPPPPGGTYPPPPPPGWGTPPPADPGGPYAAPPGGGRPRNVLAIVLAVVAGVMLLGGFGVGWSLATSNFVHAVVAGRNPTIRTVPQQTTTGGSNGQANQPANQQSVTGKVIPATVDINTTVASLNGSGQAAGTGMILTSSGEVLTNNHVVEGATSIKVTIQGRSGDYNARVLGVSPTADVALIQIDGVSGLPTVALADSSSLTVGESVVAMGNAGGQGGTPSVTQGSITALDQAITASNDNGTSEQLSGLIESDAPIAPGDSGGPLANASGQVVGMITAGQAQGFRRTTTSDVGYAIPASTAVSVVNQIRSGHGSSSVLIGDTGYLGVAVRDLDPATASNLGLNVSSGAYVSGVSPGTPAEQIGLAQGSVITAIGGTQIQSSSDLGPAIQSHRPGDKIQVTWVDQSGTHKATATLIKGPVA